MKTLLLLLLLVSSMSSCARYSQTARQQRSYEKYVRQSSVGRQEQRKRLFSHTTEMASLRAAPPPSRETAQISDAPASVTSSSGDQ